MGEHQCGNYSLSEEFRLLHLISTKCSSQTMLKDPPGIWLIFAKIGWGKKDNLNNIAHPPPPRKQMSVRMSVRPFVTNWSRKPLQWFFWNFAWSWGTIKWGTVNNSAVWSFMKILILADFGQTCQKMPKITVLGLCAKTTPANFLKLH